MIRRFRVQNYKAIRDVSLDLTPLHVLIGPNDSGKTSLLEAVTAFCRSTDHDVASAFVGSWEGRELISSSTGGSDIHLEATATDDEGGFQYGFSTRFGEQGRSVHVTREEFHGEQGNVSLPLNWVSQTAVCTLTRNASQGYEKLLPSCARVSKALRPVTLLRWTARNLSLPSALNPARRSRLETSGFGLASLLDTILSEDRRRFDALEAKLKSIFPQIETLQIPQSPAFDAPVDPATTVLQLSNTTGKSVRFRFKGQEQPVTASQASDGLLYVLGYLSLLYSPEPPRVLLIEEPENGVHPNRLREVIGILRQLIEEHPGSQVLMTTHSPYVLDEFRPEEVTLCRRQANGTIAVKRLSESDAVRRQLDMFTLGEIWTAEGDEAIAAGTPAEAARP